LWSFVIFFQIWNDWTKKNLATLVKGWLGARIRQMSHFYVAAAEKCQLQNFFAVIGEALSAGPEFLRSSDPRLLNGVMAIRRILIRRI
jgi:hypothetical protein